MSAGLIILGGGQAGFQLAASARAGGYAEPIRIIGREDTPPYQRPPLSKAYLLGKQTREQLMLQRSAFFDARSIDLITGRIATQIDRHGGGVVLDNGSRLPFDRLAIATGARNRALRVPGADLDGVFGLRTLADVDRLRESLEQAEHVVVIGAGFIGLEFAAVARQLGRHVLVIEAAQRVMARAVPPEISDFFQRYHEARGVRIVTGDAVRRLLGDGRRVKAVERSDGSLEPADLVLVGIGVVPEAGLAAEAGLAVDDGVVVDETLFTADPRILAVGDCAAVVSASGARRRLESVQNAVDQGRHAARSLLGHREAYDALPWFWSDQYDLKLQIVGITAGADTTVMRGDPDTGRLSVFSFREGRLLGVDSVNRPADHAGVRKLMGAGATLHPDDLRDPDFDLPCVAARAVLSRKSTSSDVGI